MSLPEKIRIIAGQWRSRQLPVLNHSALRPTPNRVRETLFNWLGPGITQARCLDLFAGTGALGFEALSRGASHVSFVEQDASIMAQLQSNAQLLNAEHASFYQQDALAYLSQAPMQAFDVVFLDPPYQADLLSHCLQLLVAHPMLNPQAKIYLEAKQPLTALALPASITLIRDKKAGHVYYGLAEYKG